MQLERITPGLYRVSDGDREVKLTKGLDRKWTVTTAGAKPRTVAKYADAKRAAADILTGEARPSPVPHKAFAKGPAIIPDFSELAAAFRLAADQLDAVH